MTRPEERRGWHLACLIISSLLFASVALAVVIGATDGFDAATRTGINRYASPDLTRLARALSILGSVAVLTALTIITAAGLWIVQRQRAASMLLLVMGVAAIMNPLVKVAFARTRPEAFFGSAPESFSFASGHALFSACYFTVVASLIGAHVTKTWQRATVWMLALCIIAGIGLSRVYLGVHHLTDVMAGYALAALIICSLRKIAGG